jgi:CubicO group peptidase (beta-lactamase class C family)
MLRRHDLLAVHLTVVLSAGLPAAEPAAPQSAASRERIAPYFAPPAEYAGDYGQYRSPLKFDDGRPVTNAVEWARRREEILRRWHNVLGPWPAVIEDPHVEYVKQEPREGFTQHSIRFDIAPDHATTGYVLIPEPLQGPKGENDANTRRPAVVVVYYEPETGVGLKGENRDFARQLAQRGFVTLSIGLGGSLYLPNREAAQLQPLSALAYAAANAWHVLAAREDVDRERIGIVGHSYGGKWAMFASCLYDRFACGVWCDGGIVFDETRSNVNYWEPWYLGYEGPDFRQAGIPSETNPRTGAYRRLIAEGHDLHELHALMAPRPFLVSGGSEDPPERWRALNHSVAVNRLLGHENRVAMTNRPTHAPTPESNAQLCAFFEHFLQPPSEPASTCRPDQQDSEQTAATAMAFPGEDWDEASPESQGMDSAKLAAAIEQLRQNVGRDGVRELVIVRNGRLIWKGDDVDKRHGVWSVTKSFTSTALGLLIDDGKATLDTRATDHVPALRAGFPDVTLGHLTTMTSGYRAAGDEPQGSYRHGPSSTPFVPSDEPLFAPPGSKYAYWDSAMNQFAHVLTKIAGEPLRDLFQRRIADPIGLKSDAWTWGDFGEHEGVTVNGGAGNHGRHVQISARQLARLGHLFLNRGRWNGRQLLSESWIDTATRVHVPATLPWAQPESDIDGRGCYGCNWWRNGEGPDGQRKWPGAPAGTFAAIGFNNNHCFVVPEWNLVVVRLGLDGNVDSSVWSTFFDKLGEAIETQETAGDAEPE